MNASSVLSIHGPRRAVSISRLQGIGPGAPQDPPGSSNPGLLAPSAHTERSSS